MTTFVNKIKSRRTNYNISNKEIVSIDKVEEIIKDCVLHIPSAFNIQSSKVVVLFKKSHQQLWDIVKETLKNLIGEKSFASTEKRIDNCFRSGYGTVLFFDDTELTKELQEKYPLYKDNFPIWAEQSSGMLQFAIWTALCNEGLGVSLQHYNPIIDDEVKKTWNIPANYKLIAQMPFGNPLKEPEEKDYLPIENRVKFFNE